MAHKTHFVAIKEGIRFEGKQDIQTKVMIALFGLFAEVERDLWSCREVITAVGEIEVGSGRWSDVLKAAEDILEGWGQNRGEACDVFSVRGQRARIEALKQYGADVQTGNVIGFGPHSEQLLREGGPLGAYVAKYGGEQLCFVVGVSREILEQNQGIRIDAVFVNDGDVDLSKF